MRVDIDIVMKQETGLPMMDSDHVKDGGPEYKIRKAVFWPCGGLHSVFYLSFITGEWMMKTEEGTIPVECIMGPELRKLLDPKRSMFDRSPKHPIETIPAAYGLQAAFDAEKVVEDRHSPSVAELRPLLTEEFLATVERAIDIIGWSDGVDPNEASAFLYACQSIRSAGGVMADE